MKYLKIFIMIAISTQHLYGMQQALLNVSTNIKSLTNALQQPIQSHQPTSSQSKKYTLTGFPTYRSTITIKNGPQASITIGYNQQPIVLATIEKKATTIPTNKLTIQVKNLRPAKRIDVTDIPAYNWYGVIENITVNNQTLADHISPSTITYDQKEQLIGITIHAEIPDNPQADSINLTVDDAKLTQN